MFVDHCAYWHRLNWRAVVWAGAGAVVILYASTILFDRFLGADPGLARD